MDAQRDASSEGSAGSEESAGSGVGAGLERLCREMVVDLDLSGATVTLMVSGGPQGVVAASDAAIRPLDALQFDSGEGPSRDAFNAGRPVLVADLGRTNGRWPGFVSAGVAAGICAVYAFPLQLGAVRFGALTGYSDTTRSLVWAELSLCALYAEVATEFLIDTSAGPPPPGGPETFLEGDVRVRSEVYQAQGMVKVDLGVSLAVALARLRALAFAEGVALNLLAGEIVAGRRLTRDTTAPDPPSGRMTDEE